jgi:peptidoglycan glycosyltransferase
LNQRIRRLLQAWIVGCAILVVAATYYQAIKADELSASQENPRMANLERDVVRGSILDRNGNVICDSVGPGLSTRVYRGPDSLAPLVGYASPILGKSGLEAAYDVWLSGRRGPYDMTGLLSTLTDQPDHGCTVRLTIDVGIQKICESALSGRRGAAVVVDATTGELLAVASSPWYSMKGLELAWDSIVSRDDSPLVCRATCGMYPPGSTIKIAVAAIALDCGVTSPDEVFECGGSVRAGGTVIHDPAGTPHGRIDLCDALSVSCNTAFVDLGLRLGPKLHDQLRRFFFDRSIPLDVPTPPGNLKVRDTDVSGDAIGQLAIGQGDLLVTPMHVAMMAAAVANRGVMMRPYLVASVHAADGTPVMTTRAKALTAAITPSSTDIVADGMMQAVKHGTARSAARWGYDIGGKTGTAQNPHGSPHAWFAGFGMNGSHRVAVAVVLENAGAGGAAAAPLGGDILRAALESKAGTGR